MENAKSRIPIAVVALLLGVSQAGGAQAGARDGEALSARHQGIVLVASHTARGDLEQLDGAFRIALDAGLTINETKEVLLQLSAYCGFPRTLRGINTLMAVLEDREARGINDPTGPLAAEVDDEARYELGRQVLAALTGRPQNTPRSGYAAFFPTIEQFLKEHLFADIFGRGVLSFRDREITTVAALVSMGGVEPYAGAHMRLALNVGVTESQLTHLLALIEANVSETASATGHNLLSQALASRRDFEANASGRTADDRTDQPTSDPGSRAGSTVFPRGRQITSDNFTGSVWVTMLVTDEDVYGSRIGNVTFAPGARTNWHAHPGGQILLATDGAGYYQQQGGPIQLLRRGDVVEIGPDVVHWHGATPSSEFAHIAVVTNTSAGATVWLQPVTDDEYHRFW